MMDIDEAIAHAEEYAGDCCTDCKKEHMQLATWLRELKERRQRDNAEKLDIEKGELS